MTSAAAPAPTPAWTVSTLTAEIERTLQSGIKPAWLEGEVSNLHRAGSGHCYFTLKDAAAQIRAVLWQRSASQLDFELSDGLAVLAFGSLEVYAGRGQYQWTVQKLLPKGIGPLELAFRQRCEKLQKEGLFDPRRKRPLQRFPRAIALISSRSGAAIRDFLEVTLRRWPAAAVYVLPATVQGDRAVPELLDAMRLAQRLEVDAIALVRGGGSLEDLWAFNDEGLARAIAGSRHPVVTGVGHEIDVTIADLVADVRALTPSEAAERLFPNAEELVRRLERGEQRLCAGVLRQQRERQQRLDQAGRVSLLRLPLRRLAELRQRLERVQRQMGQVATLPIERRRLRLASLAGSLSALSPLAALARGYCIVQRHDQTTIVRSVTEAVPGAGLDLRLTDGRIVTEVKEIQADEPIPTVL